MTQVLLYRCEGIDIESLKKAGAGQFNFVVTNSSAEIKNNINLNNSVVILGKGEEVRIGERLSILYPNIYLLFLSDKEGEESIERGIMGSQIKRNRIGIVTGEGEEEIVKALENLREGKNIKEKHSRIISEMNRSISERPVYKSRLKDYLDQLLEHAPIGVLAISEEGVPEAWNKKAVEIVGKDLSRIKHISEIFTEEVVSFLENAEVVKDNQLSKVFHIIIDFVIFKSIELTATPVKGESGNKGFLLLMQDVTERELTEAQLRQISERLKRAEETSLVMITHIDLNGNWTKVSEAFANFTGYTEEELLKLNLKDITHSEDIEEDLKESEKLISGEKTSYELQKRYIKKDGKIAWVYLNRSIVRDEQNEPVHFLTFVIDITEQKRNEELILNYTVELKEINASKDKLFSIISHDLKSPLHSILNLAEMIAKEGGDIEKETLREIGAGISGSTSHLIALLENLLEWSMFQSGRIEYTPAEIKLREVAEFVINIVNVKALNKEIKIINRVGEDCFAFADKKMIISVLQNLITNAIKFTNKNGVVEINSNNKKGFMEIEVKDNGVGMDEETREKLFKTEASVTTAGTDDERGTGLGLIITRDFIKKNGGRVYVESEPGKGTSIKFTLPERE